MRAAAAGRSRSGRGPSAASAARIRLSTITLIWEELGFTYLGPIDGHDIQADGRGLQSRQAARHRRSSSTCSPTRAKVSAPAEAGSGTRGLAPFGVPGAPKQAVDAPPTRMSSRVPVALADEDQRDRGDHCRHADGTGLRPSQKRHPDRFFDVGIAEQHAVTFAAGLAVEGLPTGRGDLLDLLAARLRPDHSRCRHPAAAGRLRHRPGGAGR